MCLNTYKEELWVGKKWKGGVEDLGKRRKLMEKKKKDGKEGRKREREKGEKAPEDVGEDRIRLNVGRLPWI